MIVSFHPLISADKNLLCAGRNPGRNDLEAVKKADAVILPQGCKKTLYETARRYCRHVFPNYDTRFAFPGKLNQIVLFRKTGIGHPKSFCFANLHEFRRFLRISKNKLPLSFPFVFKFDWGGEGDMVFLVGSSQEFRNAVKKAERFEYSGQEGFLLQKYIPSDARSLRLVVIGEHLCSYWRIQEDPNAFKTGLSCGSSIDHRSEPDLVKKAEHVIQPFLKSTKINLAGFDFIFSNDQKQIYMLEINYFFGRRGLGGSDGYFRILIREVNRWLQSIGHNRSLEIDCR